MQLAAVLYNYKDFLHLHRKKTTFLKYRKLLLSVHMNILAIMITKLHRLKESGTLHAGVCNDFLPTAEKVLNFRFWFGKDILELIHGFNAATSSF